MKKALLSEKNLIVDLLSSTFQDVPGVNWVIGNGPHKTSRLRGLLRYAVDLTFHQGVIYRSDDGRAAALLFRWHLKRNTLYTAWLQARLALFVIGLRRLPEVLAREHYIARQRPQSGEPYLYCWFIGSQPGTEGLASIADLKDGLFQLSRQENLPLYMETTVQKMLPVYTRYGFKVLQEWQHPKHSLKVWFLKRDPFPAQPIKIQLTPNRSPIVFTAP